MRQVLNSTGKFAHKYSIQELPSASDVIDFAKISRSAPQNAGCT